MEQPEAQEPTPSPNPSPQSETAAINGAEEAAADSSPASARPSPAASPFIAEPGPAFDAEAAPPGPESEAQPQAQGQVPIELGWEEETVQQLLEAKGELLHGAIGVAEEDWRYTLADLKAIGGPLTRILNRYPATAAAAAMGDPVALALGMGAYGVRSVRERAAVLKAIAEAQEQPITGRPAETLPPEPAGGGDDLQWTI